MAVPVVQAPLAGGPSTPALAAAVSGAGGLGFVAAGYRSPNALAADIAATRSLTDLPFGVNVFAPSGSPADPGVLDPYLAELRGLGVPLGEPRFDDDHFEAKIALLVEDPVAVVSFTFGCPPADVIASLPCEVWVTVTDVDEARQAVAAGADALIVQGAEAGGHRGSFTDGDTDYGLLALLQLVGAAVDVPLIAAGGIATGRGVAAVLSAGAVAAQLGTAFMRCPEAGTPPAHQRQLAGSTPTAVTRAFTGRRARGIVNRFLVEHTEHAPSAYPEIHHVTAPFRAKGRADGDADVINMWAGQTHELAEPIPAAELVASLAATAREALSEAAQRLGTA
jgi:nitronate monooxygenase